MQCSQFKCIRISKLDMCSLKTDALTVAYSDYTFVHTRQRQPWSNTWNHEYIKIPLSRALDIKTGPLLRPITIKTYPLVLKRL